MYEELVLVWSNLALLAGVAAVDRYISVSVFHSSYDQECPKMLAFVKFVSISKNTVTCE